MIIVILQKRFVKGLRLYGKNFFKIRKELLSHKETVSLRLIGSKFFPFFLVFFVFS